MRGQRIARTVFAFVSVVAGFVVMLPIGFRIGDHSGVGYHLVGAGVAFGIVFVTFGVYFALLAAFRIPVSERPVRWNRPRPAPYVPSAADRAAADALIAEMAAYRANPAATRTCEHLAPIERAIRVAGHKVDPINTLLPAVIARCFVRYEALQKRFALAPSVRHIEQYEYDDRGCEVPYAAIRCDGAGHSSWIETIHPDRMERGGFGEFP